jgi:hypothetical protein
MGDIIGYDNEGNPIYGEAPKKDTGKSFNDSIKDLFWDVLGREPRPEELSAYSRDFGAKIDSDEEQIFFDRSQKEIQGRNDPILNLYKEATGGREPGFEEYRETRKELGGDISAEERAGFLESYVDPSFKEQYKTLSPSDPVYRLFSQELGRKPTLQEYRQFEGTFGATPTEQQRRAVRAVDPEVYGTRLIDQYRYMTGGQDPSEAQRRLVYQGGQENFTPQNLGEYLASQNLAGRDRYGASPTAGYVAKNLSSNINPFTRTQGYVPLSRPNVSSTMNQAGGQYYQTPTSMGANYIGAPTNIAPITQGFQPVGQPSVPSSLPTIIQALPSQQWAVRAGFSSNRSPEAKSYPVNKRLHNSFNQWAGKGKELYRLAPDPTIPDYRKRLMKAPQKSLKDWTQQKWRTKSGKPSTQGPKATGERYLPEAAIKSLSSAEYAASTRAKRAGKAAGKQFVAQPKRIARKTARHR